MVPLRGLIWSHRLALVLSGATLILILFGGLVTNTGAALAVPDWPTTFGYNMFFFPWSQMVGGIFYEHSHRLIGSVVGILTALLALVLWVTAERRWLRWLGVGALVLVSAQGVLGGLRVVLHADALAVVHGALAQAFFGLTVALVLFTSREWSPSPRAATDLPFQRLALLATGCLYLQIVFGALLTHRGWLVAHLGGAVALLVIVPMLIARVVRLGPDQPELTRPAIVLAGLLALQLLLGLGSYAVRFTGVGLSLGSPLAFPIAHRLAGALVLAASLVLTLRAYRISWGGHPTYGDRGELPAAVLP